VIHKVKSQYNKPRDDKHKLVQVLQPGLYSFEALIQQARDRGWKDNIFPCPDSPNDFPYWDTYLTDRNCPEVLVSRYGEVACCYNREAEKPSYKILEQQWNKQWIPNDTEEQKRQKYLYVYLNNSPYYNITHSGLMLHSMVGLVHSPIALSDTYWDGKENRYRLKPNINLDHLDTDKANNSVFNLNWTTGYINQIMINWSIEQKRKFFEDAEVLNKQDRDILLINQ